MFSLYTVDATKLRSLFGDPGEPGVAPTTPSIDGSKVTFIGQAPDCQSYLVISQVEHPYLIKQTSIPAGYDFIFRQSWGLTINEEIIHRVVDTLRAEAYPPMADYLDAIVKGDMQQEAAYIDACKAVKAKYPKFSLT